MSNDLAINSGSGFQVAANSASGWQVDSAGNLTTGGNQSLKSALRQTLQSKGPKAAFDQLVLVMTQSKGDQQALQKINTELLSFLGAQYDTSAGYALVEGETNADVLDSFLETEQGQATRNAKCGPIHNVALQALAKAGISAALVSGTQESTSPENAGAHLTLIAQVKTGQYIWFNYGQTLAVNADNIVQAVKLVAKLSPNFSTRGYVYLQGSEDGAVYIDSALTDIAVYDDEYSKNSDENLSTTLAFLKRLDRVPRVREQLPTSARGIHPIAVSIGALYNTEDEKFKPFSETSMGWESPGKSTKLTLKTDALTAYALQSDVYGSDLANVSLTLEQSSYNRLITHQLFGGLRDTPNTDLFDQAFDKAAGYEFAWTSPFNALEFEIIAGETKGQSLNINGQLRETTIDTALLRGSAQHILNRSTGARYWLGSHAHLMLSADQSNTANQQGGGSFGDSRMSIDLGADKRFNFWGAKLYLASELGLVGDFVMNNTSEQRPSLAPGLQGNLVAELAYPMSNGITPYVSGNLAGIEVQNIYNKSVRSYLAGVRFNELPLKRSRFELYAGFARTRENLLLSSFEQNLDDTRKYTAGGRFSYAITPNWSFNAEVTTVLTEEPHKNLEQRNDALMGLFRYTW